MIRKALVGIGMTALVAVSAIRIGSAEVEPNLYPTVGYVTEVDTEADTVTWNDGTDEWTFYGVEDWMVGDGIAVIMSDEGTESVKDDRMVEVRYWNPDTVTLGYWGEK